MLSTKRINNFVSQYKGFSTVFLLEIVFVAVLVITSLGKVTEYELDSENLIIKDSAVIIDESGNLFMTGKNDEIPFSRWIISSDKLDVPHGMYELEVNYSSMLHEIEQGGGKYGDGTGIIQLISENSSSGFEYNDINLFDGQTSNMDWIWVRSLAGIDDLEVKVCFLGEGDLFIRNITIRELPLWRLTCIMVWILLFAVIDALYLYFFTENTYQNKRIVFGLLVTIIFSSMPLSVDELFLSHDIKFHLLRIWSLARGIQNGHWIVPIQTEVMNGYGYVTPLFYSQLFLYIPALLYCMAVPLQICYQIYIFLVNAATALICYYCVKWLFKDKELALFASFLYTLSAYRIVDIYVRGAVGEFTAMAFLPLVAYGFIKVYMTEKQITWREYLPIVVGLSGIVQCHVLSCEMVALFILALCLLCVRRTLQPFRLLALVKAAMLTCVVNVAFLLPFLQSMQMNLQVREDVINEIQWDGAYLLQVLGIFMPAWGGSGRGMTEEMPLAIGFAFVIGMFVFAYCCVKRYEWKLKQSKLLGLGMICFGFASASIVMSLRVFPWDDTKNISRTLGKVFSMIQFPWRYLTIATVFCLFTSVIGIRILSKYKGILAGKLCCGSMVLFTVLNVSMFYMQYADELNAMTFYGNLDQNIHIGQGEYLPTDTDYDLMFWRKIVTDETVVTVDSYDYTDGVTTFWCQNDSDEEEVVEIPLLNYDNYHAYALDIGQEFDIINGQNNCIGIVIRPHYEGTIRVQYEIPFLWKLSYIISGMAVIATVIVVIYDTRRVKGVCNNRGNG